MKKSVFFGAVIIFLLGLSRLASAQVSPTMYTLDDIYYYLADGTTATAAGHSLQPPSGAVPGDTRFKTLKQIYELANAEFEKCDAAAGDVREGYQFYSVQPGSWGVQSGTKPLSWYDIYGPNGTNDVIKIGSMYVASDKNGAGCAYGGEKNWSNAVSWATGLSWLEKASGWRLPDRTEGSLICENRSLLASWDNDFYWTSDAIDASNAYAEFYIFTDQCSTRSRSKFSTDPVRAVRTVD